MSIFSVSLGVFLCFLGLIGFSMVMYLGFQARNQTEKNGKYDKKTIFEQLIIINYIAICLSAFGLILLVLGLVLR